MGKKKRAAGPTSWKVSVVELENLFARGKTCQARCPGEGVCGPLPALIHQHVGYVGTAKRSLIKALLRPSAPVPLATILCRCSNAFEHALFNQRRGALAIDQPTEQSLGRTMTSRSRAAREDL